MTGLQHIAGKTWHGRKGAVDNAFRYGVDYVLLDAEAPAESLSGAPRLFGRNRAGIVSLHDRDHGGAPGEGRGAAWVREVLAAHGLQPPARIELLAQPRVLGHVFNPVAFWICRDSAGEARAVIAEVNNTYGDRHSYLCHHADEAPITAQDRLQARKIFYVSPFQPVAGDYEFRFDLRPDRVGIWIDLTTDRGGLVATLTGRVRPLTLRGMAGAALRRPMGSRRVLALIHWQALKLWWKGAQFRTRPAPPTEEVSR